jgi:antitoxin HicB
MAHDFRYPIVLTPDEGTLLVTVPDIPEAITFGEDEADALARAADVIESALAGYMRDRRDIPTPSAAAGRPTVALPLSARLKLETYVAMRAKGWRKADLARALGCNPRQVDRLFDLHNATTVDQFDAAMQAIGRHVSIESIAACG